MWCFMFVFHFSMGIAGVRTVDNQKYFEDKRPLCVVYYDIDYALNPKGILSSHIFPYTS